MDDSNGPWVRYNAWNSALAETWFSEDSAFHPAYVDVDAAALQSAASRMGVVGDPTAALVDVVRESLWLEDDRAFAAHRRSLDVWRAQARRARAAKSRIETPPPVMPLLGVFTVAAEQMGASDTYAANAYRPRLEALLRVPAARSRSFQNAFTQHSEVVWRALNEYLELNEGLCGLPTAYSLGHRYVGLPQSQALVRTADRRKLPQFFRLFGFAPRSEAVSSDLERLLDIWIGQTPSPVSRNLSRLWKGKARERIAGIASVELSHWDGSYEKDDEEGASSRAGELRLTVLLRRGLGGRRLELSFAARFPTPVTVEHLTIESAEGKPRVAVLPSAGARMRPAPMSRFDAESLVGAAVSLSEPSRHQTAARRPRRVLPLQRDDLLGVFVEVEKIQLTEDAMVLVKDEPKVVELVKELLSSHGRHGDIFAAESREGVDVLPGLPTGWLLIDGVEMFAVPGEVKHADLNPLVPLMSAQMSFAGGLKMPGRVRKWSSQQPPEIRAAVSEASRLEIALAPLDEKGPGSGRSWTADQPAIVVDLSDEGLADGDYEVTLAADGTTLAQTTLRLRSGDTPDLVSWTTSPRLVYELDGAAIAALSAVDMSEASDLLVDGPRLLGEPQVRIEPRALPDAPTWLTKTSQKATDVRPVVMGVADPHSCLVTGRHYLELPRYMGGKTSGQIQGVCRTCGLVKSFPGNPRKPKRKQQKTFLDLDLTRLPAPRETAVALDTCLDALVHVGGGSMGSFERVATQAEGSSLFVDDLLRTLEGLGHVDVKRDLNLLPLEWEITPTQLAELADGSFLLTGAWSAASRSSLRALVEEAGGALRVECSTQTKLLSRWSVEGLSADLMEEIALAIGDCFVARDAAARLLAALPPLSQVTEALPLRPIPMHSKAQKFDLASARWVPVPGVAGPGAYRVEQSFRTISLWVDHEGAIRREGRQGSVQLVKHIAASAIGRPLAAYSPAREMLFVPLGSDLPGLYGRVATLCGGSSPLVSTGTRTLAYTDVPRRTAESLAGLLTS